MLVGSSNSVRDGLAGSKDEATMNPDYE